VSSGIQIEIGNIRETGDGEYVGRMSGRRIGSPLANPYRLTNEQDRTRVLNLNRAWLRGRVRDRLTPQYREMRRLAELAIRTGHLRLLCWCHPLPCHAEDIRELLYSDFGVPRP